MSDNIYDLKSGLDRLENNIERYQIERYQDSCQLTHIFADAGNVIADLNDFITDTNEELRKLRAENDRIKEALREHLCIDIGD